MIRRRPPVGRARRPARRASRAGRAAHVMISEVRAPRSTTDDERLHQGALRLHGMHEVVRGPLVHEWAAHDLMHTVQAERALMQPFVVGSGPWRSYFADHDVGGPASA